MAFVLPKTCKLNEAIRILSSFGLGAAEEWTARQTLEFTAAKAGEFVLLLL